MAFVVNVATNILMMKEGLVIMQDFSDEPGAPGNGRVSIINEYAQQFNGLIYSRDENGRYCHRIQGRKHFLHIDVWTYHFGEPPADHYVIQRNGNRDINDIENLMLVDQLEFLKQRRINSKAKETICEWCGKTFEFTTIGRPPRFCSNFCRNKFNRERYMEEQPCVICGKSFKTYKYHPAQTCSNECRLKLCKKLAEEE